ncbi:MAG: acyl carrier protein [Armatimonadota bacterium]
MPANAELKQQIKDMIVERLFLSVSPSDIPDEGNLMDLYNIDSVNLFEIVVGLEEDFGISLEDADFSTETFSTVENIAGYVEQKRG